MKIKPWKHIMKSNPSGIEPSYIQFIGSLPSNFLISPFLDFMSSILKQLVDQHRSEKSFDVGDWVFLWLHLKQAIYDKEMLAILHALKKWWPYPMGRHFKVKMDHDSLKYVLEQILSLEEHKKWVTNMLGYDFDILYRKGKKFFVANALSKKRWGCGSIVLCCFYYPTKLDKEGKG